MKHLDVHPTSEVNKRATHILFKQMGIVDTYRFLNQFTLGSGDYTKERSEWLDDLSLDEIISGIHEQRKSR